jgi:regulator of protease activity HflC (stomatin/prohibitin superfamily)
MDAATILVTTAVFFIGLAMLLGFLAQRGLGASLLGIGATTAVSFCLGGARLGYDLGRETGAWLGLVSGMLLAAWTVPWLLGKIVGGKSRKFFTSLWLGFCALSLSGYMAAGWIGLLTITLPSVVIFWLGLYLISIYILPLRDASQQSQAFRSLMTFTMGTNYPFYFVNDQSKPDKRVDGNPFGFFLAGPGLVYTPPDHAAYISNKVMDNRVGQPGLTFTRQFDLEPEIVDLRVQLRTFDVEARTKDGIPIKVLTFVPFRIDSGNQRVELGGPFPFRPGAVHKALAHELTERKSSKQEGGERYEWDGKLVPVIVTRIMQDIIGRYTVDELCEPGNLERDPRVEIAAEMRRQAQEALRPYGLEVVGGGISNLVPQDGQVVQQRIKSWQTNWRKKILERTSEAEAYRVKITEEAKAKTEQDIVQYMTEVANQDTADSRGFYHIAQLLQYLKSLQFLSK